MTRSYRSRLAGIQQGAKRRQAELLESRMEDSVDEFGRSRCGNNRLTAAERRQWAIVKKEERRDLGLVDGLRFETEEESAEYLRKREEEAAAARPDRRGQAPKKRTSFAEKTEFKDRNPDYEKQKEMVAAMSRQKAQRMVDVLKKKYGGAKWPKDVCRLYRLLQNKALLVEA